MRNVTVLPLLAGLVMALGARAADKPNIVVILADDLGYGDVQCYNPSRGKIATPNIDRIASQGMRFTDGHSSSGVCSPSRYALLTGRYHWRTRLQQGIVNVFGAPLIAPDRLTIAGMLKQQGYQTACVGKWHLGWDWPIPQGKMQIFRKTGDAPTDEQKTLWKEVFSQPIPGGPTTRGFDSYFGTCVPNWPPYCFIENDRTVGIPSEFLGAPLFKNHQASLQGPALAGWKLEPILPALGDRACAFIAESAGKPQPFFLYMPLTAPHTPLAVSEEWKGKSGLHTYADFVMETDLVVGRVLEAIEKSGAAGKTLLVFTSDNGCAPYIGAAEMEKKGHFPSGPLRGYKADAYEGGHRIPFIVRWPGVVKPGTRCDQYVLQADLMATFAEVLGVKVPPNAGEDSFSFLPLLKGENQPTRPGGVNQSSGGMLSVRKGPWKLIVGRGGGGYSKPGDDPAPAQLYNLADDPGETRNLYLEKPEVAKELMAYLETLIEQGRSTPGDKQANDVPINHKRFLNPTAQPKERGQRQNRNK